VFGDLDTLSFVRISWLHWLGHVNRMDGTRGISQVFNNNPLVCQLKGGPKNRCLNFVQTDINKCKIKKLEREVKKQS
jgi:hypothetical protein